MFRIVCFVEDKKLAQAMHALAGIVTEMEVPTPVVNATTVKGKITATSGGTAIERLTVAIHGSDATTISSKDINSMFKKIGAVPSSKIVSELVKGKVLKREHRGTYRIL